MFWISFDCLVFISSDEFFENKVRLLVHPNTIEKYCCVTFETGGLISSKKFGCFFDGFEVVNLLLELYCNVPKVLFDDLD